MQDRGTIDIENVCIYSIVKLDISVSESELESTKCLLRFLASYTESINLLKYLEMLKSIVTYSA